MDCNEKMYEVDDNGDEDRYLGVDSKSRGENINVSCSKIIVLLLLVLD